MRPDMSKVLEERARQGASDISKRAARRTAKQASLELKEDLNKIESMRENTASQGRRDNGKVQNKNLAPLRRWLRSQVGRPWDSVYSEICETIERRLHPYLDVIQDAFEVDGAPWYKHYRGVDCLVPKGALYLHEGTLRQSKNPPLDKSAYRTQFKRPYSVGFVQDSEDLVYRKLKGIWFELKVRKMLPGLSCYDIALKRSFVLTEGGHGVQLCYPNLARRIWDKEKENNHREFYGDLKVFCYEKRQLNSREIQKLNLNEKELT